MSGAYFRCYHINTIEYSDAIIQGEENIDADVAGYIKDAGKPTLDYQSMDTYISTYNDFYNKVLGVE